jgi:hypothetical protein
MMRFVRLKVSERAMTSVPLLVTRLRAVTPLLPRVPEAVLEPSWSVPPAVMKVQPV